jgi:hypothetical protein
MNRHPDQDLWDLLDELKTVEQVDPIDPAFLQGWLLRAYYEFRKRGFADEPALHEAVKQAASILVAREITKAGPSATKH